MVDGQRAIGVRDGTVASVSSACVGRGNVGARVSNVPPAGWDGRVTPREDRREVEEIRLIARESTGASGVSLSRDCALCDRRVADEDVLNN